MAGTIFWIGSNGHAYVKYPDGSVSDIGNPTNVSGSGFTGNGYYISAQQIDDPLPGGVQSSPTSTGGDSGGSYDSGYSAPAPDPDAALRAALKAQIAGYGDDVNGVYGDLFHDLTVLLQSRGKELESEYGSQFKKTADQYAEAIPQIETSYASIGAGDSTDNTYAKVGAKKGFDDTTATIGKNKRDDEAKLGAYGREQRAKFEADKVAAARNIARAGETTEVDALRSLRNDLESNLDTARVTRASLGTDSGARGTLAKITANNGRYEAAVGALDTILKSSLSGGVKKAAVEAVTENAGLSEEEKKKVQETYGNVYAEQAAL